jgi:hypothetical protein
MNLNFIKIQVLSKTEIAASGFLFQQCFQIFPVNTVLSGNHQPVTVYGYTRTDFIGIGRGIFGMVKFAA